MQWETVIGLEIHAQLATQSKIFSGSSTAFGAAPNTQASLVDLAMPGTLPVLNEEAVRMACLFGLAIDARIDRQNVFARKNYFYPDLPKGYQTSQMDHPIVGKGHLDITLEDGTTKRIGITRAHLEEDAGKSLHEDFQGMSGIDLNRAGTPLLEIVSSRTSAAPRKPWPTSRRSTPWCATWASATATWPRARCAATATSRYDRRARPNSAPAPRSRTSTPSASSRRRSTTRSSARSS